MYLQKLIVLKRRSDQLIPLFIALWQHLATSRAKYQFLYLACNTIHNLASIYYPRIPVLYSTFHSLQLSQKALPATLNKQHLYGPRVGNANSFLHTLSRSNGPGRMECLKEDLAQRRKKQTVASMPRSVCPEFLGKGNIRYL